MNVVTSILGVVGHPILSFKLLASKLRRALFKAWSADILQTDLLSTNRYQDVFVLLATGY